MLSLKKAHFFLLRVRPYSARHSKTLSRFVQWSSRLFPVTTMSSRRHRVNGIPCNICSIVHCQIAGADATPKASLLKRYGPLCVWIVRIFWVSSSSSICRYACQRSSLLKITPPEREAKISSVVGRGYLSTFIAGLTVTL